MVHFLRRRRIYIEFNGEPILVLFLNGKYGGRKYVVYQIRVVLGAE
jgi:hypothetical protein